MAGVAEIFGWMVVFTGETPLPDRLGQPDFAIHRNQALAGYDELKAPVSGANTKRFKGRNRERFNRFSAMANTLLTDGNEWALYQNDELSDKIVRLQDDVSTGGASAVTAVDAVGVEQQSEAVYAWISGLGMGRRCLMKVSLNDR
ncbi:MAG: hypothetical protein HGB15_03270 [Chlorobaculum sp.]|nr:hypothetical protein [Chlorobaculum sp.]